jgi:uncharacterized protein (TIGR03437 family)
MPCRRREQRAQRYKWGEDYPPRGLGACAGGTFDLLGAPGFAFNTRAAKPKNNTKSETVKIFGAGLYRVNVMIPANVASGNIPLVATAAGLRTPSTVMITVQ